MQEVLQEKSETTALVKNESHPVTEFAQVNVEYPRTQSTGITITLGEMSISIPADSNTEHVKILMQVIANAKRR